MVGDGRFRALCQSNCISVFFATSVQRSHRLSDVLLIARLTFNRVNCVSCGTQRERIFYVMQFLQSVWSSKRASYVRLSHNSSYLLAQSVDERQLDACFSSVFVGRRKMITRSETSTNQSGSPMNRPGSAAQSGSEMNRSGSLRMMYIFEKRERE